MRLKLPIDDILTELTQTLQSHNCLTLVAPPGSGKTTRVPSAALMAVNGGSSLSGDRRAESGGKKMTQVIMLEPRRIAARTAARRIAEELGESVGRRVGYAVRFEQCLSNETEILVVTEGVLLRRLQTDPFLENVGAVIFDEFHERRLDSDLAISMVRRIQQTVREDLRIVVMSATLEAAEVSEFLGHCPLIRAEGRCYPVEIEWRPLMQTSGNQRNSSEVALVEIVKSVLPRTEGHILVFLPGVGEIRRTEQALRPLADEWNRRSQKNQNADNSPDGRLLIAGLFGDMTAEEQDRVFRPTGNQERKIILATNVAETSLTIEGVTTVIDTGLARQMQFDSDTGLDRLELRPISRASAEQRAGRAGRTGPGLCIRLWDAASHRIRPESETPEIRRVDLSGAVLQLICWGETQTDQFPWFAAPPSASLEHAHRLLCQLGAVDPFTRQVTNIGRIMERFPVAPRLARLLVEAMRSEDNSARGFLQRCCLLVALLSERSPFQKQQGGSQPVGQASRQTFTRSRDEPDRRSDSDVIDRLKCVEEALRGGNLGTPFGSIPQVALKSLERVSRQLYRSVCDALAADPPQFLEAEQNEVTGSSGFSQSASGGVAPKSREHNLLQSDGALLQVLAHAFPDRVARRREPGSDRALMVGGRGVRLAAGSSVRESELFLCLDVDGRGAEASVRLASAVQREWLPNSLLRTTEDLFFHPTRKQVVARRRLWFDDLMLEETPCSVTDRSKASQILFEAARPMLQSRWLSAHQELRDFLTRWNFLREWIPEQNLSDFSEPQLEEILQELCQGRTSFDELDSADWLNTVRSRIDYSVLQWVDREAPERIGLPGGARLKLVYEPGRPPVLAVRIQDVFGWKQTPRVAGGRVAVLLHLLAPNRRPQQITDDLASFWANTYAEVRKELRRRYPKHSWPEDPTATGSV